MTAKAFSNPIGKASLDAAARLTRISMDSAERVIALQLGFARSALEQATRTAHAASGARAELVKLAGERLSSFRRM